MVLSTQPSIPPYLPAWLGLSGVHSRVLGGVVYSYGANADDFDLSLKVVAAF